MHRFESFADFARHYFEYDPMTGALTWRFCRGGRAAKGRKAGTLNLEGYLRTRVDGREYLVHRLIWALVHGEQPNGQIDHINGVRDDNRLVNLRCVDAGMNQQNRKGPARNGTSGFLGVSFCKQTKKWRARIVRPGQNATTVGRYHTKEEASAAYFAAKARLHPGFVQPSSI